MVTSASQSVFNVCEDFGKYVKFVVEIGEHAAPLQSLNTTKCLCHHGCSSAADSAG